MSTGISISSINRIKELADKKNYREALEILDTQDLEKSMNPQFLRVSGEIFRENKRYYDSRKILLKAHMMAPQGLRILAEIIQLYLELGYFTKAMRYYEQYMFYTSSDDTQKDFVEYIVKKSQGADVVELASILIPNLERMPEDCWNFEAILLYDKMGRKDKALEECTFFLGSFKDSNYIKNVMDYIDDCLDVDSYFYVYPRVEVPEDTQMYKELIELEDKILQDDYVRMYPPEATIMVEVDDQESPNVRQNKVAIHNDQEAEKKTQSESEEILEDEEAAKKKLRIFSKIKKETDEPMDADVEKAEEDVEETSSDTYEDVQKSQREAALEKLLAHKLDSEKVKESARQAVDALKQIDSSKAKEQIKMTTDIVKDRVIKAASVLEETIGIKIEDKDTEKDSYSSQNIMDGIIEEVEEIPKKTFGQVVINAELDSLLPDSLEAMSLDEINELETKRAELERQELEELETQLKIDDADTHINSVEESVLSSVAASIEEQENDLKSIDITENTTSEEYERLKEQFYASDVVEEETPAMESLGFISVVQSDVDSKMEKEIPDAANILHQMIQNKEFYTGEDSTKFESNRSYENHGFEVEDYAFDELSYNLRQSKIFESSDDKFESKESLKVEEIYIQQDIIDFGDIITDAYDVQSNGLEGKEERSQNPKLYDRKWIRGQIVISDYMKKKLLDLKESR